MKQATEWIIAAFMVICLVTAAAQAEETDNSDQSPKAQQSSDSDKDLEVQPSDDADKELEIQETAGSDKNLKGEVRFRYDWLGVNKDRGRFREDNWMTDRSTGGLDWLHLESTEPDENGYEWLFEGRALHDYDYRMSLLMKKEDSHYLKFDFSGLRRYFDGYKKFVN